MEKIICPHCNKEVELSEALFHEVKEKVSKELKAAQKAELERVKEQSLIEARKRLEEEVNFKLKNSENEAKELKDRNKELQDQLLELNKRIRELIDQNEKTKLENERRVTEQITKFQQEF